MLDILLLLDFDQTVLSTARLRRDLFLMSHAVLTERGLDLMVEDFQQALAEGAKRGDSLEQAVLSVLPSEVNGYTREVLGARAAMICHFLGGYVYPDAARLLARLRSTRGTSDVRVVTFGNDRWQINKLRRTGLGLTDRVHVTTRHGDKALIVRELATTAQRTIYADDSVLEVHQARLVAPDVETYLVRRPRLGALHMSDLERAFWLYEETNYGHLDQPDELSVLRSLDEIVLPT